jgi:hypothetical protein
MGYECPVCSTPQADARHLANHMAMTAMLGREDHADWLDEHTPGWNEAGEKELAPRVAEHAEEKEFPQVFEDTVGGLAESEDPEDPLEERGGALFDDGHDHGHAGHSHEHGPNEGIDVENLDPEARAAIEEAREMTEAMLRDEREQEETDDTDEDEEPAADDGDSEGD